MKNRDLNETLIGIGRTPGLFYRDTAMLFQLLDNLESINRRLKNIGHKPERRNLIMLQNQAE